MLRKFLKQYQAMPLQAKASVWFLLCSFAQKAVSAVSTPIFTRLLTEEQYGQYNVFVSWQSILGVFITLYLCYGVYSAGLVKFSERRDEYISAMQGLTLALILAWGGLFFLFRDRIAALTSLTPLQTLCMFSLLWTGSVYQFWAAEQRVYYRYRKLVAVTLLATVVKPALEIAAVLHAGDDGKVTARILMATLAELGLFSWMFGKHVRQCGKLASGFFWRYALKFNIPLIPHYLSQNILTNSDRIMIERMVSADAAGIYSLAYSVSFIMNLFNVALTQTISPWVYEKIKARKERDIQIVTLSSSALIALANLILILLAPEIVRFFAPPSYYEAVWTIPPVAMSVYFIYLYNLFSYYEFYYEKTSFIAAATVAAALTNLVLNYFCIRLFGYIAAGYTTLVCYMLYAAGHYWVMNRVAVEFLDGNKVLSLKPLLVLTSVFMALGFAFCALYNHPAVRYAALLGLTLALFLLRKRLMSVVQGILSARNRRV